MIVSYRRFGELTRYFDKKQRIIYTLVNKDGRWGSRSVDALVYTDPTLPAEVSEIRWGPLGGSMTPPQPTAIVVYSAQHRLVVNAASTSGVPSGISIDVPTFDLRPGDISRAVGNVAPTFYAAGTAPSLGPVPVGPQYEIGDTGPQGGKVVSITPGSEPQPFLPPELPSALPASMAPPLPAAPIIAPPPIPAEQLAPGIKDTGTLTVVDMPGAGPTPVPVLTGPVSRPEIIAAGPGGRPVVIIPRDQPSNLPVIPRREAVGQRAPEAGQGGLPPGDYNVQEFFPSRNFMRRSPAPAVDAAGGSTVPPTGGSARSVDTDLVLTSSGMYDAEGRPYPGTTPATETGARASAAASAAPEEGARAPAGESKGLPIVPLGIAAAALYFVFRR